MEYIESLIKESECDKRIIELKEIQLFTKNEQKQSQISNTRQLKKFNDDMKKTHHLIEYVDICFRTNDIAINYFPGRHNGIVLENVEYELLKVILRPYQELYPLVKFYNRTPGKRINFFQDYFL
jgi:sulfite reductase alpha subunit-like flavoprotein